MSMVQHFITIFSKGWQVYFGMEHLLLIKNCLTLMTHYSNHVFYDAQKPDKGIAGKNLFKSSRADLKTKK